MKNLDDILYCASDNPPIIALSEGADPRILEGAKRAFEFGLAKIILIGDEGEILEQMRAFETAPSEGFEIQDPKTSKHKEDLAQTFFERRKHKGVSLDQARKAALHPLNYAALLVASNQAHGTLGGAVYTTGDTVRAALQIIGRAKDAKIVSSYFMMAPKETGHERHVLFFSDCALIIDPNPQELADIAIASSNSFENMTGAKAQTALLSFSSFGSGSDAKVTKVQEATALAQEQAPHLQISGEVQFDTAFVPRVAEMKAPDDKVAGRANVFIFPDLNAGNIGYKIAQYLGDMRAVGPVLQGLASPANDLSRGCSAQDVFDMIAVTAKQAARTS